MTKKTRSELLQAIEVTYQTLESYHQAYKQHQGYFKSQLADQRVTLLTLLLPSFLMGWRSGRKGGIALLGRQLLKMSALSAISRLKR